MRWVSSYSQGYVLPEVRRLRLRARSLPLDVPLPPARWGVAVVAVVEWWEVPEEAQGEQVSDGSQVVPVPPLNVADVAYSQRLAVVAAAAAPEQGLERILVLVSPRV